MKKVFETFQSGLGNKMGITFSIILFALTLILSYVMAYGGAQEGEMLFVAFLLFGSILIGYAVSFLICITVDIFHSIKRELRGKNKGVWIIAIWMITGLLIIIAAAIFCAYNEVGITKTVSI